MRALIHVSVILPFAVLALLSFFIAMTVAAIRETFALKAIVPNHDRRAERESFWYPANR